MGMLTETCGRHLIFGDTTNLWLTLVACVLMRPSVRGQTKKGKQVNEFGNKDKNRKFNGLDLMHCRSGVVEKGT
jgi:hypothetical protein